MGVCTGWTATEESIMATINTNMPASIAANSLTRNERSMTATMERLSTGVRINSAKDDAAGLAITSKMTSQVNGLNQAVRNANDAISMIQVGEGALKEVTNMLQRMRELAIQASSDSNTLNDRTALNNEFTQLRDEISRISANTQWNGAALFASGSNASEDKVFQVGANANQTITVKFENFDSGVTHIPSTFNLATGNPAATGTFVISGGVSIDLSTLSAQTPAALVTGIQALSGYADLGYTVAENSGQDGLLVTMKTNGAATAPTSTSTATGQGGAVTNITVTNPTNGALGTDATAGSVFSALSTDAASSTANINNLDITTRANASKVMFAMDGAVQAVNDQRARLGASMSRLEYASDNLQNIAQNTQAARSRVLDADYASETTELARTQIIQQAGTAMLSQANQQAQSVLALLK